MHILCACVSRFWFGTNILSRKKSNFRQIMKYDKIKWKSRIVVWSSHGVIWTNGSLVDVLRTSQSLADVLRLSAFHTHKHARRARIHISAHRLLNCKPLAYLWNLPKNATGILTAWFPRFNQNTKWPWRTSSTHRNITTPKGLKKICVSSVDQTSQCRNLLHENHALHVNLNTGIQNYEDIFSVKAGRKSRASRLVSTCLFF